MENKILDILFQNNIAPNIIAKIKMCLNRNINIHRNTYIITENEVLKLKCPEIYLEDRKKEAILELINSLYYDVNIKEENNNSVYTKYTFEIKTIKE